jgi:ATP-dependent RNA helicase RhlE
MFRENSHSSESSAHSGSRSFKTRHGKPFSGAPKSSKPAFAGKPAYAAKPAFSQSRPTSNQSNYGAQSNRSGYGSQNSRGGYGSQGDRGGYGSRGGFAPRRSGGFGGGSRGGFRSSNRSSRFEGEKMHYSRFINKAVVTEQTEVFVPAHKFADFAIDETLKANILAKGFTTPTPIQDKIIPYILDGKDVVGIANTGTGKTGAFLIPLMQKAIANPREKMMIIVPTRELAIQIDQEFRSLKGSMEMYSVCCVGGASIGRQISELRYHNSFIIGTPGRLKDLIQRGLIKPAHMSTIVLDEADRMLDMGFINDMHFIMDKMPENRHTLFFSATMDKQIETLVKSFLHDPVNVSVKTGDTAKNVEQDIVKVLTGVDKLDVLHDLLNGEDFSKVIIFGRTKHGVEKLSIQLTKRGFKAESIHGDKPHAKRQKALGMFKDNSVNILVATDVAARGLDIPNVSHVINYDLPATYDDYIHRIGRTGRAGKKGKALTFVDHRGN